MENIGRSLGMAYKSAERIILVNTYDNSGAKNRILKSEANAIANLQAKMNVYWHSADPTTKWVCLPRCAAVLPTYNQPTAWELEWYKTWMQAGTIDMAFTLPDVSPFVIKQASIVGSDSVPKSFYLVSGDKYLLGQDDGTYITPIQIQDNSILVQPNTLRGFEKGAENVISFRLNQATDLNDLVGVLVADGYPAMDTSYYSLVDVICTVGTPATTGGVFTLKCKYKNPLTPGTDIPLTGVLFGEVSFTKADGTNKSIALTANWVETAGGVYTLTEVGIFSSGVWTYKFSHPRYEVLQGTFTVG